jgi:hypothetical protein
MLAEDRNKNKTETIMLNENETPFPMMSLTVCAGPKRRQQAATLNQDKPERRDPERNILHRRFHAVVPKSPNAELRCLCDADLQSTPQRQKRV